MRCAISSDSVWCVVGVCRKELRCYSLERQYNSVPLSLSFSREHKRQKSTKDKDNNSS
jgi:hypothetical protein